jgi:hypothetical protein
MIYFENYPGYIFVNSAVQIRPGDHSAFVAIPVELIHQHRIDLNPARIVTVPMLTDPAAVLPPMNAHGLSVVNHAGGRPAFIVRNLVAENIDRNVIRAGRRGYVADEFYRELGMAVPAGGGLPIEIQQLANAGKIIALSPGLGGAHREASIAVDAAHGFDPKNMTLEQ